MSSITRWITGAAASAILFGAIASCVSDRTTQPKADLTGCNVQLPSEAFGSTIVVIRNFAFTPAQVTVKAGSKVTWVNCEDGTTLGHTTTSDAGVWTSALLLPGATFTRTFDVAGTFPYHCQPHPGMQASVVVE